MSRQPGVRSTTGAGAAADENYFGPNKELGSGVE
ncbi:hypothetical protein CEB3_c37620 [Peptococcaceae bacterium CEB3]|nr:hypothetical protein CEB3_c37620 [Peptococcaceae bacterium CEB3]